MGRYYNHGSHITPKENIFPFFYTSANLRLYDMGGNRGVPGGAALPASRDLLPLQKIGKQEKVTYFCFIYELRKKKFRVKRGNFDDSFAEYV